jgi:DNA-binding CsgD family transcriptional regulator
VRLQRTVSTEQGRAAAAEGALEALAVAAFLLDGQGRLLHANGPAQRLLQAASAVRARPGGRLTTASPGAALGELVARACRRARGGGAAGVETLLLRDGKPGEPERLAIAYPLPAPRTALREHWPRARVALYVGSLAETGLLSAEVLAQAYGLTPAEARLAAAVAGGRELGELSEEWAVSTQTLRTQLKAVFAKTGVRRQTELVRLLAGAPWRLAGTGATMEEG